MLSVPDAGWTDFQLGSEETRYSLSYLTDVPLEWLGKAIFGLETMDAFSVHGFCEPGRMVCTVSYWNCYIIFEGDNREDVCESVHTVHVSMIDFCRKLYADISNHLEDWVCWDYSLIEDDEDEATEEKKAGRRKMILDRLEKLKELIERTSDAFGDDTCFF